MAISFEPPPSPHPPLSLGISTFRYEDLFIPEKLAELTQAFFEWFAREAPAKSGQFQSYRAHPEAGTAVAKSEALLAAAPYVGQFVARLFGVEHEVSVLKKRIVDDDPLFRFKREFAKKRVLRPDAGKAFVGRDADARAVCVGLLSVRDFGPASDEELRVARATLFVWDLLDTHRKAEKGGGATWSAEHEAHARALEGALLREVPTLLPAGKEGREALLSFVLDALEAWLAARLCDHHDSVRSWASLHAPKNLNWSGLVELRRPSQEIPELLVGPEGERRQRGDFRLSDRRGSARVVESEVDYCLFCHDREKDSCSKGLLEPKTKEVKKNPLGVPLEGCPLEEKISETHAMRQEGEVIAALALVCIDNPMCPGTGHRICNDCMKACIFQKQEPVNIPQVETRVLTEVLGLPWGFEIYGLLTRWNPLNVTRPHAKPYRGANVLVVGLGPAGYTLSHHLACEGFGVCAIDGLKLEPLPAWLVGDANAPPTPVRDVETLFSELDERSVLGFGGVSEYGITVRWDKNFLTVLYATLLRNRHFRAFGGIRFGGTLTLDDAWRLGFDHVAIAAGAGRPTIIDMKNNLSRGIRKASDFLMALQLSGAYKKASLSNLQVSLPAVVIGGGLTAIDTATELLAYYVVQIEKEKERFDALVSSMGEAAVFGTLDTEEKETLCEHLGHARELAEERDKASAEGREPNVQGLLSRWGGVTLVYRRSLSESPAYRLNHEEVAKSLEEGVRYMENLSPVEAVLNEHQSVKGVIFAKKDGTTLTLPAKTVCVAAGTSPNVTYEREYPGTFLLDKKGQYFQAHVAVREAGTVRVKRTENLREGFFTSYEKDGHTVSFYGDNHPHYAGSVVKAMASAKDGYPEVCALFPEGEARHRAPLDAWFSSLAAEWDARVHAVRRLTDTIVEIVVHAPMAARKFEPGQFYRLQNFDAFAKRTSGVSLAMEGVALTGAWVDRDKGLLGTIVLEMGHSSRLCAFLEPGEPVVLMGPTGAPTEIAEGETVLLAGGGLGNAVLFSIARAYKALGGKVLYFAGYKRGEDLFKQDELEAYSDQLVYCTDSGRAIAPRRVCDRHFRGNIVQAMVAYAKGELGDTSIRMRDVHRILAIGSDRMMDAVREARHGVLLPFLDPKHLAIGSINSPMQCMMKEVCAQCLQKHRDPETGKETVVFSCFNQDQALDHVDFGHLRQRLRTNSMQEKLTNLWLTQLLKKVENA